ncbi:hypothetical protein JOD52_001893 [Brachybacterium muris]|uniref:ATP synthase n=1 Tax=Brachybacterium muris UCD-AY4 TaxID=1249481 RepID=A0A022KYF3_9MICO|nr:hypothetical protein [Brachybacterium muris]EYT48200.1 hypothetical protein D641_0112820 [Brachybacterium muris UCD-AY4]MBM7501053.1 hypothetical protein [Brachybacterium muris]MCT1430190.1 hypothetical protein [Brachybacterium muris]
MSTPSEPSVETAAQAQVPPGGTAAAPSGSTTRTGTGRTAGDRGMLRATVVALIVGVVLDVVVIAVAAMAYDTPAVLGTLVGTVLTLVVVVPTVVTAYLAPRLGAASMAVTVLASWGGKMVVVVVTLLVLRGVEQVSMLWIGIALLVGALCAIASEMILLAKVRQPLDVTPVRGADTGTKDQ